MAVASTSPLSAKPATAPSPPAPAFGFLALRSRRGPRLGRATAWRRLRVEAIRTQPGEAGDGGACGGVRPDQGPRRAPGRSRSRRSHGSLLGRERLGGQARAVVQHFRHDSVIMVLKGVYGDRYYARFFALETIAKVPYFAFISVLHMYSTFGWWRRADYIKVHFAQSWNEFHHLLIMEELGGNSLWIDCFLAPFMAFFYYFVTVAMYMLSPRMAYHFSECVERHAYSTYDEFLKLHEEELKRLPAPEAALDYYLNEDLYLFDEFQASRRPDSRRPKIDNLYDVFVNIRDDEAEHCKTMKACQTHGNLRSPHSMQNCLETETECVIPENIATSLAQCDLLDVAFLLHPKLRSAVSKRQSLTKPPIQTTYLYRTSKKIEIKQP